MIPGRTLHRIAAALIPQETRERVIDAQLADFQHEWLSATSLKVRLAVLLHGYAAFWWILPVCGFRSARRETMQTLLQAIAVLAFVAMVASLIAGAGSWVRAGAISWSEMWKAGTNAEMLTMAPWMVLVQHYARTKRVSIVPLIIALVVSAAWRAFHANPQESFEHWVRGLGAYVACALIVPPLARAATGGNRARSG